jgi:hypothetical protein
MALPLDHVLNQIDTSNAFYHSASSAAQQSYGNKPSSIEDYLKCFRCGNSYMDFEAGFGDAPSGSTIQSILDFATPWKEG